MLPGGGADMDKELIPNGAIGAQVRLKTKPETTGTIVGALGDGWYRMQPDPDGTDQYPLQRIVHAEEMELLAAPAVADDLERDDWPDSLVQATVSHCGADAAHDTDDPVHWSDVITEPTVDYRGYLDSAESAAIAPILCRVKAVILSCHNAPSGRDIGWIVEETLYQLRVLLQREGALLLPGVGTISRQPDGALTLSPAAPARGSDAA
jgi:hypothetical protein